MNPTKIRLNGATAPLTFQMLLEGGVVTDDQIGAYLRAGSPYEPEVTALFCRLLRPGDTVIDVGANVGWFTMLAAALVGPQGRVVAFEPGPDNVVKLKRNIIVNGFENVAVVAQPAGDQLGPVTFHLNADGNGGHSLWDPAEFPGNEKSRANPRSIEIEATTLDQCVATAALQPRLIKLDTEGNEQRVLEGARELLAQSFPPFVIAEMHEFGLAKMGDSQATLRGTMDALGYSTFLVFADGSLPVLIPPATVIRSELILNLLFSTPKDVGQAWPQFDLSPQAAATGRPLHGYLAGEAMRRARQGAAK